MTLIKRAAKAIARSARSGPYGAEYEQMARAALAGTRNPTPAMIEAGVRKMRCGDGILYERAVVVWQAMHDAMMKDNAK